MILNLGSLAFNADTKTAGGSPAWGTELGQGDGYKFSFEDMSDFFTGMVYKSVVDLDKVTCPLGKGGNQRSDYDFVIASLFDKIYVNGKRVNDARFLLLVVKKLNGDYHVGRRTIKYNPRMTYRGEYINDDCYRKMAATMGLPPNAAWFVYEIFIVNQDELHFTAFELGQEPQSYRDNEERKNAFISRLPKDGKRSYEVSNSSESSLQQVYFGAPGTGKSAAIYDKTLLEPTENVFRVTFHPDSEYASFVGCFKPSMKSSGRILTPEELTVKLREIKTSGTTYPCHKFAAKYWESLKDLSPDRIKQILNACGFTESMNVEVSKGVAIGQEYLDKSEDGKIIYSFTPQVFTNAYVRAWQTKDPVFLIIEEINRGNCAQIFGDLFQLLDRDEDGYSKYPVNADTDLTKYLVEKFAESCRDDIEEEVKEGFKLKLPNNLHIWATMNTSDQSLFPIDSAFKRRWEWKYTPIKNAERGHVIALKDRQYDWWEFLDAVNKRIEKVTESEDKQMGYWFTKPEKGIEISAEKFVSKVVFYLWNDVFKDYGHDPNSPFVIKQDDGKKTELRFKSFFDKNGEIDESVLVLFFWGLKLQTKAGASQDAPEEEKQETEAPNNIPFEEITRENVVEGSSINETEEDPIMDDEEELPEATSIDDFFK